MYTEEFFKFFLGKAYFKHGAHYTKFSGTLDTQLLSKFSSTNETVGVAVLDENSSSRYFVFDVDAPDKNLDNALDSAKSLSKQLKKYGLTSSVWESGNKGYHLYVFLSAPVAAFSLKMVAEYILSEVKITDGVNVEVFPKQTKVSYEESEYGSHLRFPLAKNPKTGRVPTLITDIVENNVDIFYNVELFILNKDSINELIESLIPYFKPGARHTLMLGIAGYCRNNKLPISIPKYVLHELHKHVTDLDIEDLTRVIEDSYNPKKQRIAGFSILKSILPFNVIKLFDNLIFDRDNIKSLVFKIRSGKLQNHAKIESVAQLLCNHIMDNYSVYQDNFLYIVDTEVVYSDADGTINQLLHTFGISVSDSFESSVYKKLVLELYMLSTKLKLFRFQSYEKNTLRLFNKEHTICVTDNIYSSEDTFPSLKYKDFLYIPAEKRKYSIRKLLSKWNLLKEDEDLIYSYIIFNFMASEDSVKPVLLLNGLPGSGKTTLASIILKMIENTTSSVTSTISKEDDLKAAILHRRCVVLDNLEHTPVWFYDLINAVTTNAEITQRRLYTTNSVISSKPNISVIITSAYNDFSDDRAFTERTLRIVVSKLSRFMSLQDMIEEFYLGYSDYLSEIVDTVLDINNIKVEESVYLNRLTDYCNIVQKLHKRGHITNYDFITGEYTSAEVRELMDLMLKLGVVKGKPFYLKEFYVKIKNKMEDNTGRRFSIRDFSELIVRTGKFERNKNGSFKYI